jgi:hypothetical protein
MCTKCNEQQNIYVIIDVNGVPNIIDCMNNYVSSMEDGLCYFYLYRNRRWSMGNPA